MIKLGCGDGGFGEALGVAGAWVGGKWEVAGGGVGFFGVSWLAWFVGLVGFVFVCLLLMLMWWRFVMEGK